MTEERDPDRIEIDPSEIDPAGTQEDPAPVDGERGARVPLLIGGVALVGLLVVVGLIAAFATRATAPQPSAAPSQGVLELPATVGDLVKDASAAEPGVGADLETVSGTYRQNGKVSYVVIAGRPVTRAEDMLALISPTAVRAVDNAVCGRDPSSDLDVCVVVRGTTAVMVTGAQQQPLADIVAMANTMADVVVS